MLGKLFKYDFREVGRKISPLYIALAAISIVTGILFAVRGSKVNTVNDPLAAIIIIMMLVWLVLFVATGVVTLMLVARNFQDTLFGSRGYLTNTLPTRAIDHVADKTINGIVWAALTTLMSIVAVALFVAAIVLVSPAARGSLLETLGSTSLGSVSFPQLAMTDIAKNAGVVTVSFLTFSALVVSWLFAGISFGSIIKKRPGLAKAIAFAVLALAWLLTSNVLGTTYARLLLVQVALTIIFSMSSTYILSCHLNLE
ncbi:hypothetical protein [Atopobium sp. oral taxon 810]|uniref:hypothetical protein n=1 Tax=Atopobium sp. oral taxon 810 TaxID=712158 RepID=UPI0003986B93|nr:hypothetical protein [Atopobium sp. oral taxon 810]ERI06578.1 hypothetical protein HMPREF9069_00135 [Atopobium sp. oral taxon 810 str. F0209]